MPANDNAEPDEPWKRAQLLLEAHAKIANSEAHPYDHPGASIRGLLSHLMHYCAARNVGAAKDDPHRLDFEGIMKAAKTDYQAQAKTMHDLDQRHKHEMQNLDIAHEMHEPKPDFESGRVGPTPRAPP